MRPGLYPLWFLNDRLEADELRWQVAEMVQQGMAGCFLHPRQGMTQPYLSQVFFDQLAIAIDAGMAQGLSMELYDEFPYPSGAAGGQVLMQAPELAERVLRYSGHEVDGGPLRIKLRAGAVLQAIAFPYHDGMLDFDHGIDLAAQIGSIFAREIRMPSPGLGGYGQQQSRCAYRYFADRCQLALETTLPPGSWRVMIAQECPETDFKYFDCLPDTLNPRSVELFLELTHERYRARFGEHFGKHIHAMFTDEVSPAQWTPALPEWYQDRYGEDMLPLLYVLQCPEHPRHRELTERVRDLRWERFTEIWDRRVDSWCREHGLWYATEKQAHRLSDYRFAALPGCDPGHIHAGETIDCFRGLYRHNARACASAAQWFDKPGSLVECFHSMGWDATLEDFKFVLDCCLLAGNTHFAPHGFYYSSHGLRKFDAAPSQFFQQPAWPLWQHLSAYVDDVLSIIANSRIDAPVLFYAAAHRQDEAQRQASELLQHALLDHQRDFLFVDDTILKQADIVDGHILIQGLRCDVLLIPPCAALSDEEQAVLARLTDAGLPSVSASSDSLDAAIAAVCAQSRARLTLLDGQRDHAPGVWSCCRLTADGTRRHICFNTTTQRQRIRIDDVQSWRSRPLSGQVAPVLARENDQLWLTLPGLSTCILEPDDTQTPPRRCATLTCELPDSLPIARDRANILRLDTWAFRCRSEAGDTSVESLSCAPLIDCLQHSGVLLHPHTAPGFGRGLTWRLGRCELEFRCEFTCASALPLHFLIEPHGIVGDWQLRIDDGAAIGENDFHPSEQVPVRGGLVADLGTLDAGSHTVTISIVTDREDGGLCCPCALLGDFAVDAQTRVLQAAPTHGNLRDLDALGLPDFAGVLACEWEASFDELPSAEEIHLHIPQLDAERDAYSVLINGQGPWPIAWSPRRAVLPRAALQRGTQRLRLQRHTTLSAFYDGRTPR